MMRLGYDKLKKGEGVAITEYELSLPRRLRTTD